MSDLVVAGVVDAGERIMKEAGGAGYNPQSETCIARFVNGELVGGVVFGSYTGRSCELHCAGFTKRWVNRSLLWVTFAYPFLQLGCEKLFARVQASNEAALRFDTNIGFSIETVVKDVYPDGDLYILSLHKNDCRHLNMDLRPRSKTNEQA